MRGLARVKHELQTASGDGFHLLVTTLIAGVLDHVAPTKRLRELDRLGIDSYQYDADNDSIVLAVQCKGFEKLQFDKSQLAQCLQEIRKFSKSDISVDTYWLVLNRNITDRTQRDAVERELKGLVTAGIAGSAKLLDLSRLLNTLQSLALRRLALWARQCRDRLIEDYRERMAVVRYIPEVPVLIPEPARNPTRLTFDLFQDFFATVSPSQAGIFRNPPRILLYSGFGFGKTSALHELAQMWAADGRTPLYIPAALLSAEVFRDGASLGTDFLRILEPDSAALPDITNDLLRDTLRHHVAGSNDWILLIDGLDENAYANRAGAMATLWNGVRALGLPFIASVRTELLDLRESDYLRDPTAKLGAATLFLTPMQLIDWTVDLLVRFLEDFPGRDDAPPEFHEFEQVIRSGRFDEIYGDIPKRPLFLSMLAEDAASGKSPERELHRLYGSYFRRKFRIDRYSQAAMGMEARPSAVVDQLGTDEAEERLIVLMEHVARHLHDTLQADGMSRRGPADGVSESILKGFARKLDIAEATLEDLVLHSLLRPAGRDARRERLVEFSHRSFEEWFLARSLARDPAVRSDVAGGSALTDLTVRFLAAMRADLSAGRGLP